MKARIQAPKGTGKGVGPSEGARAVGGRVPRASSRGPVRNSEMLIRTETACKCEKDEDEEESKGIRAGDNSMRNSTNRAGSACDCDDERSAVPETAAPNGSSLRDNPGEILRRLGPGRPFDGSVRGRMERAFGTDFRSVQVHSDSQAASVASELGANAFTVGQHIAFASGRYKPGTRLGDALLAHELAHTIQQRGSQEIATQLGNGVNRSLERDANSSARQALRTLWTGAGASSSSTAMPSQRTGTRLAMSGCGGGSSGPCSVTGQFTNIPSGNLTPAWDAGRGRFGAPFVMEATFTPSGDGCDCHCGEYRQYVKGYFKVNGTTVVHNLHDRPLDSSYQEDHAKIGGTWYRYGYRNHRFATSKFENPDQATGCDFRGQDFPGVSGGSGASLEVNLGFKGQLVDTCNGDNVLATQEWTVNGTGTQP